MLCSLPHGLVSTAPWAAFPGVAQPGLRGAHLVPTWPSVRLWLWQLPGLFVLAGMGGVGAVLCAGCSPLSACQVSFVLPAQAAGCTSPHWHVQLTAPACLSFGKLLYANGKVKNTDFPTARQGGVHGMGLVGLFLEQCCACSDHGLLLPFSCLRHCPTCFLTTNSAEPFFFSPNCSLQNPGSPVPWAALPVQEVNSKAPNSPAQQLAG